MPRGVQKEEPDTAIAVKEKLRMNCHIQLSPQIKERQKLLNERKEELERRRDERIREVLERLAKIEAEEERLQEEYEERKRIEQPENE